ncbi:hypothetical protein DVH24_032865 [Malus domestica]|uniref:Uncharacterized protein n=1 Tax=Malus domestica TaxID=3750 RepID=A0A498IT04_MALDO|nr:hypothetical protein DVH24_032865 [Malus domestica]
MYVNKYVHDPLILQFQISIRMGILPHMDNFAQIGGFVSRFLLGFLFLIHPLFKWLTHRNAPHGRVSTLVKSKHNTYQYVLWVLSLILLIVGMVWRRHCVIVIAVLCVVLIGHFVDSGFYFVVLGCCFVIGNKSSFSSYLRSIRICRHFLTVVMYTLFRAVNLNNQCSWCHYLSSVPTSNWNCKSQNIYCLSLYLLVSDQNGLEKALCYRYRCSLCGCCFVIGNKSSFSSYLRSIRICRHFLTVVRYTLFRAVNLNNHGSWCHYLSSVPTSKWNCK